MDIKDSDPYPVFSRIRIQIRVARKDRIRNTGCFSLGSIELAEMVEIIGTLYEMEGVSKVNVVVV